ncbi:MAG: hypothetical protein GDA52_07795 [Rhodobacteraceae bacterium]|nr:hypothetical protein [Paracoccaceae bacterium]
MERKKAIFTIPKVYTNNHYLWDGGRVEDGWSSLSVYIKGIGSTGDDAVDASDFFTGTYGGQTYTWWLGFGGNDYVKASYEGLKGWFQGGSGNDTISYHDAWHGVQISLNDNSARWGTVYSTVEDHISGFEHVIGSRHADTIEGSAGDDRLEGNAGNDILMAGRGNDTLDGGAGVDWADYSDGFAGITLHLLYKWARYGAGSEHQTDVLLNFENA